MAHITDLYFVRVKVKCFTNLNPTSTNDDSRGWGQKDEKKENDVGGKEVRVQVIH